MVDGETKTIAPCRQEDAALPAHGLDAGTLETVLASLSLDDAIRLLRGSAKEYQHCLGPLSARLIELGDQTSEGLADDNRAYADIMRLQRRRLEQDAPSRRDFAMHPRIYGRPARQLTTEADDWVVPMVEAEIGLMSADDRDALRDHVIMRVGRQHDIHRDFRPIVLGIATDDRTLACLASIEQGWFSGHCESYLLAAVAGPFIDVVMGDPDDGIELEAAAWDFVQRRLAETSALASPRALMQSIREVASLLALIDTSRTLSAQQNQAQAHASLATRSAIAEFILYNLVLLATNPEAALRKGDLEIGAFVRRDASGRSPVDIPEIALKAWMDKRTPRQLLLDLVLITLLADDNRHDLPPVSEAAGGDIMEQALGHLRRIEQGKIGKMASQAIDSGWYLGDWAVAA